MRRRSLSLLTPLLALLALPLWAAEGDSLWTSDFEAAKTKAKAEGKLLLVDFTGSDWCVWCKKLKAEVFEKDAFKTAVPKKFVLVELDYPTPKVVLSDAVKAQNAKLKQQYKISGYPTVLLLDAEGKVVAKTGYQAGGPDKYVAHLDELLKAKADVDALKAKADAATGVERAKLLDQLIGALDTLGSGGEDVAKYCQEIVTLDADGKAGLKPKYVFRAAMDSAKDLLSARKYAEAKDAFEKVLALDGLTPEQKQDVLFQQGACLYYQKDYVGLVALLKKALDAAPDSKTAPQLKSMITRFQAEADKQAKK